MTEDDVPKIDWIHLPHGVEPISLWECMHDGEVLSCVSNDAERTVTFELSVPHLFYKDEKDLNILLKIEEVTSVRAAGSFRRIGQFEEPKDASNEERNRLIKEYWAKWREETLTWSDFESALDTDPLQIMDASLVSHKNDNTLKVAGFLDGVKFDDIHFEIFVRGRSIGLSRSDDGNITLESFMDLGRNYWNDVRTGE